jgi:2-(1,2-epoxy-1,2-dihydrophenyl)acetyl-CoA isomerase
VTTRSPLRYERDGAVAILTLDRPEVRNAFNEALTEALGASIEDVARDASVRAVVITGTGRAFSAGQDLDDRLAMIEKGGPASGR